VRIDAAQRSFVVEYEGQMLKPLPMRGLVGARMALEDYLDHLSDEARTAVIGGRPVGRQLRML
jgi:hypothetical protein